jgi:2-amino-4-hydroxy-6-hydroxymethyldihydropteridine diphosphokinase
VVLAYIGVGGNLHDPIAGVKTGLALLGEMPQSRLLAQSSLYRTAPLGPPEQPDYINAVAVLETDLAPLALLDAMQAIEQSCGRRREGVRWGPRTLDLDMLLYGEQRIERARLRVPHRQMHKRGFVLIPLAEVAPATLRIPGIGDLAEALAACERSGVARIDA